MESHKDIADITPQSKVKTCDNCHAEINGPFCAQCGQEAESTLKYFWTVVLHILDDIFSFDSRANRTLIPLLFRPGFLTNQYFAGHRVHYVPPLRLYLFISIVFFITLKFFAISDIDSDHKSEVSTVKHQLSAIEEHYKSAEQTAEVTDKLALLTTLKEKLNEVGKNGTITNRSYYFLIQNIVVLEQRALGDKPLSEKDQKNLERLLSNWQGVLDGSVDISEKGGVKFSNNPDGTFTFSFLAKETNDKLEKATRSIEKKVQNASFDQLFEQAIDKLPQLMFVLLPLFALLLKVMYMFSKRLYLEHLTVALHSHSFIFLAFMVAECFDYLTDYSAANYPALKSTFDAATIALLIWLPVYLFIMQKRVYKQGYIMTTIKYSITGTLYLILLSVAFLTAFIWGVADLPS